MGASLNEQRRVEDDGLRVGKLGLVGRCGPGNDRIVTVPPKEAPANSVPAAAVIRRVQALSGIIGFKGSVGGLISQW